MKPDIIKAISDPRLLRSFFTGSGDGDLSSWNNWLTFLKTLYGIKPRKGEHDLVRACTGRDPDKLPKAGFDECLLLCGRRSGKSKTIAAVGAAEAILSGREKKLSAGEIGMVAVISPTRYQSRIIHNYMRAVFQASPLLEAEVAEERREGFVLKNGIEIAILTGSHQSTRGFSLIAAIVDEVAFFGMTEESKVKNDTELIRALRPSLGTTGGRLFCSTTPFKEGGYTYQTFRSSYGNDAADILVWNAASLTMNPTLNPSVVSKAVAEDAVAANVEYCTSNGLFRSDVDEFISRQACEALVVRGRTELPPQPGIKYAAFADMSGGRHDDACLAIAHREDRIIVLDSLTRCKPPHNPYVAVAEMVAVCRRYGCDRVTGDAYSAEWSKMAFASHGVRYEHASSSQWKEGSQIKNKVLKPKSQLYIELLPRLTSGEVELLDNDALVTQLCSLQRRTRSGMRDSIDHAPGAHDDLANCLAGVADACMNRRITAGTIVDPLAIGTIADPAIMSRPTPLERAYRQLDRENERRAREAARPRPSESDRLYQAECLRRFGRDALKRFRT